MVFKVTSNFDDLANGIMVSNNTGRVEAGGDWLGHGRLGTRNFPLLRQWFF